jgi:phage/plasmid primase-like uncharacterized protein
MMIIDLAKAVPIEIEIARRGAKLIGRGSERCGPCPVCGGRDRFSINLKKRVWNCRGCTKGGDVLDLVQHLDGVDFGDAIKTLVGVVERKTIVPMKLPTASMHDEAENTQRALRLWDDASSIGTLARTYLLGRNLEPLEDDNVLRFHGDCPFAGSRQACLLALYRDIHTNKPKAISRTAIDIGGNKIGRMALGPVKGCAIKIDADENVEHGLTVGEGLETCLAGRELGFRPIWSLGSADAISRYRRGRQISQREPAHSGRPKGQGRPACRGAGVGVGSVPRRTLRRRA